MADEQNNDKQEPQDEAADAQDEAADAQDAPAEAIETTEAEPSGGDEPAAAAGGDAGAADAAEGATADAAGDSEEAEPLGPKQRRKLARSRATGPPRPPRTPEERAAERAERRRAASAARRRYRLGRRAKRGEPRTGTPPAERRSAGRKVRQGTVVSSRASKTITVRLEITRRHRTYEKVVRRSSTVHAHDERDEANEGDIVRVVETRPLSRTKRWRLLEIVERAR